MDRKCKDCQFVGYDILDVDEVHPFCLNDCNIGWYNQNNKNKSYIKNKYFEIPYVKVNEQLVPSGLYVWTYINNGLGCKEKIKIK